LSRQSFPLPSGPLNAAPLAESLAESAGLGRKLKQEESTTSAPLQLPAVLAPLAEAVTLPSGVGRRLSQAGSELPLIAAPVAEALVEGAGLGRKLTQVESSAPLVPAFLAPLAESLPIVGRKLQQVSLQLSLRYCFSRLAFIAAVHCCLLKAPADLHQLCRSTHQLCACMCLCACMSADGGCSR
jgi:hypothetical protein